MNGPDTEVAKKCSWCGAENPASAHTCSKCSAALTAQSMVAGASTSPEIETPAAAADKNRASRQPAMTGLVESSVFDDAARETMRSLGLGPTFVSGQTLAFVIAGCLSLYILLNLVIIALDVTWVGPSSGPATGMQSGIFDLGTGDVLRIVIALSLGGVAVLTGVLFLVWIYRAHKNLKAFGAIDLKYSPRWAVGRFFVPILNLIRPYQVVTEIWKSSAAEIRGSFGTTWKDGESAMFIGLWWGAWLLARTLDSLGLFMVFGASEGDQLAVFTRFRVVSEALNIACAALAMMVVLKINARQENTNRLNNPLEA